MRQNFFIEIINITKQAGVLLPRDDFGTVMPQSLLADATRLELQFIYTNINAYLFSICQISH